MVHVTVCAILSPKGDEQREVRSQSLMFSSRTNLHSASHPFKWTKSTSRDLPCLHSLSRLRGSKIILNFRSREINKSGIEKRSSCGKSRHFFFLQRLACLCGARTSCATLILECAFLLRFTVVCYISWNTMQMSYKTVPELNQMKLTFVKRAMSDSRVWEQAVCGLIYLNVYAHSLKECVDNNLICMCSTPWTTESS